ncbi:MAG: RNA-binding S4 domain-containing protein [Comamonadaceae bacterium]|nr:MAG: RNA-binding S4 domain-containing protein [Comamonadaceae bacterium]
MAIIEFTLNDDYIEINQLLKLTGICDSGGRGKQLVAQGIVRVSGEVELRKTAKIRAGQVVTCGPDRIVVRGADQ